MEKLRKEIVDAYWDDEADSAILRDWILDNEYDTEADMELRKLQSRTGSHDEDMASAAFRRFAEATGLAGESGWSRVRRHALRTFAALFAPVAAVAVIAIISGRNNRTEWNQITTSYGESRNLTLADGSTVRLGACSKVVYPDHFAKGERKIFLTGEAYLDIAKDPDREFKVSAGEFDVVVYGTRFTVRSWAEGNEDEVSLLEGSISLDFPRSGKSVDVHPGEMVKYNKMDGSISCRTFSTSYYDEVLGNDGLFFENMQLSDIASCLSRRFGVPIIIEDSSIGKERYFASFINNETLDDIMSSLNTKNHLSLTRDGDAIRIYRRK